MLNAFFGASGEVIQVGEHDLIQIMKNVCHGTVESVSCILKAERHDMIRKSSSRGSKFGFVMIDWVNLNLILAI